MYVPFRHHTITVSVAAGVTEPVNAAEKVVQASVQLVPFAAPVAVGSMKRSVTALALTAKQSKSNSPTIFFCIFSPLPEQQFNQTPEKHNNPYQAVP